MAGSDAAWIDQLAFAPERGTALAESLDAPSLGWTHRSFGALPWRGIRTEVAHDATDAAVLTIPPQGGPSWIETGVEGNRTLRFWWRTDAGRQLKLFDGVEQEEPREGSSTGKRTLALTAGRHTLRWEASATSGTATPGAAGAWLDQVTLEETGFAAWASSYGLSGPDASALADPDHDSRVNLVEYAFNLSPITGVAAGGGRSAAGGASREVDRRRASSLSSCDGRRAGFLSGSVQ